LEARNTYFSHEMQSTITPQEVSVLLGLLVDGPTQLRFVGPINGDPSTRRPNKIETS